MIRHVSRNIKSSWRRTPSARVSLSAVSGVQIQSQSFSFGRCRLLLGSYLGPYYNGSFRHALSSCKQQHILRCFSAYPDFQGQYRLLTEEESALLAEQRALTEKAKVLASLVETVQVRAFTDNFLGDILPDDDQSTFSIVIAGEFNSGKSTLINALLGTKLLETGALPTTDSITILTHGSSNATQTHAGRHGGVILHQVSGVSLLQDVTLIDTPGTNAVVLNHTARTMKLLPSADLILFVTSADRPFPDSERAILKSIQSYRKNIVVVINKMDVLETSGGNHGEEEKRRVVDFVTDHASELLGARPIVIPISARDAISAKIIKDQESGVWKRSNFAALESFLKETLTTLTKIKSKLINPIGVAEGMVAECLRALADEKRKLEIDISTLNLLKSQLGGWDKEMSADMESFRQEIGSILSHEGARCERLQKRMSLFDMYMCAFDEKRLYLEWKRTKRLGPDAVQGIEEELLSIVRETADLVATRARAQGQAVIEYLGKRPAVKSDSLVGKVTAAAKFEETRESLVEKLSTSVRNVLNDYNETVEEDGVVQAFRQTAAISGALQFGAIGMIITTAAGVVDVAVGMTGTAAFAACGSFKLLRGFKRVSSRHQKMWQERQGQLDEILQILCSKELERGVRKKILAGVLPYTRYVEAEEERIYKMTEECEAVQAAAQTLRNRIEKLRR